MRFATRLALVLLGVVTLTACSGISATADWDRNVDFSRYRTYAWKDVHRAQNAILENRIKNAVDSVLASKGLRKTDGEPDLWVVEHTRITRETVIETYNTGWGYGWRWGWGPGFATSTVQQIPIGKLMIDLVDARAKELVWRGTASKALDPNATPEEKDKSLNEAVRKMFANFPPGR